MKKAKAICLKTYPDEDHMMEWHDGERKIEDIQIYFKGQEYPIYTEHYDSKFWKIIK